MMNCTFYGNIKQLHSSLTITNNITFFTIDNIGNYGNLFLLKLLLNIPLYYNGIRFAK